MNNIKVKRLNTYAVLPSYTREGDAAFDLVSVENHIISPQATVAIGTGLAFEIPTGFEVEVVPRSGISLKTPLRVANSPGTIDENYRGELKVIMTNIFQQTYNLFSESDRIIMSEKLVPFVFDLKGEQVSIEDVEEEVGANFDGKLVSYPTFYVRKGDKLAQGKLREVFIASFQEVNELSESNRGTAGFGSSGINVNETN